MKLTKLEKVARHLKAGKSLTNRQSIRLYHYYRLASGINRLRVGRKMRIVTKMVHTKTSTHARYSLSKS